MVFHARRIVLTAPSLILRRSSASSAAISTANVPLRWKHLEIDAASLALAPLNEAAHGRKSDAEALIVAGST